MLKNGCAYIDLLLSQEDKVIRSLGDKLLNSDQSLLSWKACGTSGAFEALSTLPRRSRTYLLFCCEEYLIISVVLNIILTPSTNLFAFPRNAELQR